MIFDIVDVEIRESRVPPFTNYYMFKLQNDGNIYFLPLAPVEHVMKRFHEKMGIYWGDKEPFAKDYIGFLVFGEIKLEQYGNRIYKKVDW